MMWIVVSARKSLQCTANAAQGELGRQHVLSKISLTHLHQKGEQTQWGYLCLTLVPCSRYGRSSSATLHASKIPRVSSFVPGRVQKRKVGLSFQCTGAQEVLLHWSPSTTILTVSFQVIITKVGHSCSSYYICRGVSLYYFQPNRSKR